MSPDEALDVKYLMEGLQRCEDDARNIQAGNIGATVQGRYIEDHLNEEDFEVLRELALRYVAQQAFGLSRTLRDFGIALYDQEGAQLDLIDQFVTYYKRLFVATRRTK